mmetsp:Transcript_9069/g.18146  ORF Transcript_9069/g.18146 Transcript_9069/m.18146 type:complete len:205 (-) Transcript_9069:50-664(-)
MVLLEQSALEQHPPPLVLKLPLTQAALNGLLHGRLPPPSVGRLEPVSLIRQHDLPPVRPFQRHPQRPRQVDEVVRHAPLLLGDEEVAALQGYPTRPPLLHPLALPLHPAGEAGVVDVKGAAGGGHVGGQEGHVGVRGGEVSVGEARGGGVVAHSGIRGWQGVGAGGSREAREEPLLLCLVWAGGSVVFREGRLEKWWLVWGDVV